MKEEGVVRELNRRDIDADRIQKLELQLKQARDDLQEYITAEKVMIAAGKVSEDTVRQAHEISRACS